MPLIKIDKDRYVNSDRIIAILPREGTDRFIIVLGDRLQVDAPSEVINHITQSVDANETAVFEQPQALPLASQLAIYLRDKMEGKTFREIIEDFAGRNTSDNDLQTALNEILSTGVVKVQYVNNAPRFYHASNIGITDHIFGIDEALETADW